MFWLMICRHFAHGASAKDALRPAHRAHVRSGADGRVRVLIGSALGDGSDPSVAGNWGIIEAETRDDVLHFAQTDPFTLNGLVDTIEVTALPEGFPSNRIIPFGDAPSK